MKALYPRPNKSAYEKSIDFLAKRDHSEKELREKLEQRQYTVEEIQDAIDELHERNYILPPEVLAGKVARILKERGKGLRYIVQYLGKKGLPPVDITTEEEFERGKELIERKLGMTPPFEWEQKVKIKRYLGNRGFQYDSIMRVINDDQ